MDVIRRRAAARNSVVSGSVWESRMKSDEVKGGIRVFNGEENFEEDGGDDKGLQIYRRLKRNQNGGANGKRKTWNDSSPSQIRQTISELQRLGDESCEELNLSVDSLEKSPIQIRQTKSQAHGVSAEFCKDLRVSFDVTGKSPKELSKTRSESNRVPVETTKELQIGREKIISSSLRNVNFPRRLGVDDDGIDADGDDEKEDEEFDLEIEVEKKSYDDKEVNVAGQKPSNVSEKILKKVEEEEEDEEEKKVHQILGKPIPISADVNKKPSPVIDRPVIVLTKPKKVHQIQEKPKSIFSRVNKQPAPIRSPPLIDPSLRKPPPIEVPKGSDRIPETPNKLQNFVDLVMWRDVSKSAFVFGVGSFFLFSSSFSEDFNVSLISGIFYIGLVYLAAIFFYKSILCRGAIGVDNSNKDYIVGEEEAVWVLRLILPYLNEFLLKLRSLFSGDPATTMKLAVLLFVLARCGSSITMWKMTKFGFFAVFTVPKVCSSYSSQLAAFGKLWIRRFRDAWDSCTQNKATAAAVVTLMCNFSSVAARIWAVFMFVVAVRYYQQLLFNEDCGEEEMREGEDSSRREGDFAGLTTMVEEYKKC